MYNEYNGLLQQYNFPSLNQTLYARKQVGYDYKEQEPIYKPAYKHSKNIQDIIFI